jgi:tyrosyl-tRNA synthetase
MPNARDAAAEDAARLAGELAWGAVDSLPHGALEQKLAEARAQERGLRVKLGIDPTAPDIHLGHAVVLRKLRQFQDAGHKVVLIVGDYTARVGDPSGRTALRPMLSEEQIEANAATFREQALRILDADERVLEVRRNSEWLDMPMSELLALVRTTTVAQLTEREDFAKRLAANDPVSMLELLYPLLQGYDSVMVAADVELGGTDQKFNLLLGRDIQRAYGRPQQAILTMPILVGTDGRRKMSKSLGNHIGITEPPQEIYGKTMAIPDDAIEEYRRLLLDRPPGADAAAEEGGSPSSGGELPSEGAEGAGAELSPRDAKRALARGIVSWLYSHEQALEAERHFDRLFVERGLPDEIDEAAFACEDGMAHLPGVIAEAFGVSRSEARRLIDQGGVSLGEALLGGGEHDVACKRADGQVLKVGKRRFVRLRMR